MKKILSLILIFITICLLYGCTAKQLNERMVIQGMGIDYVQDEYKVTVMYMNTDISQEDVSHKTATGKGRTVTEAVTSIVSQNGLEPLYSHNSFILLGESICNEGVGEALEFFAGYYQCRPTVNILVADRDAEKIMKLEDITPGTISKIAESNNTTGRTITTPMYIFLSDILNNTSSACTALVTVKDDVPVSDGIAVFKGDKFSYSLNSTQSIGVMLIRGESDISAEVIPLDGKNKSFALDYESTDTTIKVENGVLYCDIKINGEATIYEYTETEKNIEQKIEERVNKIIKTSITECAKNGSDVFYFGKLLRQSDSEVYHTIKDWSKLIEKGVYSVSSDISVN
ncbi:MAG: Ger(x)C family spore germination C-terminal domain-containing protein [Acutalibacteraceae bacterium]|nr:Ger(x)C family spore germination C-terminal domain-containing protein [Acutalibacteraceae bacterium]